MAKRDWIMLGWSLFLSCISIDVAKQTLNPNQNIVSLGNVYQGTTNSGCPCPVSQGLLLPCPGLRTPCQGCEPLPQQLHSRARLQLPTAIPSHGSCSARPNPWAHVPACPWPIPIPREVPNAWGWSCPDPDWGGTAHGYQPPPEMHWNLNIYIYIWCTYWARRRIPS